MYETYKDPERQRIKKLKKIKEYQAKNKEKIREYAKEYHRKLRTKKRSKKIKLGETPDNVILPIGNQSPLP